MVYSGDEFWGDDETSGHFMGCEICGRYECPGECETPDEPDVDNEPQSGGGSVEFEELPY